MNSIGFVAKAIWVLEPPDKVLDTLSDIYGFDCCFGVMIRAFADAKEKYELPTVELDDFTSFPDGK